mmetsp:Transcript_27874/g.50420  ORF Transcript_27874/g.50420 Transcript_27874/m.50420 type:complete len:424 (-) Transcript_27874:90-1361(-)|eukprot:CAMPEP_0201913768 /NCGR_PEP_ID=MMETSP0903-20130614/4128_1 /ASSEMBLY_ACC=CAM_ASM_000552 /TAXON_ID=420261 /ORGANISM="Thalassiosira antarctica, Strain CCMP982" /LENGTH=423 /DNA_ID=CAMNT_0048449029 /DNA_START=218 /DNA_END=1489 /DNA_ORIENTATION=+
MPIASAANWTGSQSNISSRSSMVSNETPHSNHINNGGHSRGDNGEHSQDDFHENNLVPCSIEENPQQPSYIQASYSIGEESTEELSWLRQKCGEIVDDERTQTFILLLIAVNSIMIGVATFPVIKQNPDLQSIFETVDLIVLVIFTIESIVHFIFNGFRRFFKDGWLVFDLIIVAISWVAVIIAWVSVEISALQALRVFRALRFVTQVSILRNVIVALFSIVPAITAIFTLLILIFYIFAVMFTALFKDLYTDGHTSADYFGRMDYTLFTLFQLLCMDEWSGIAYEVTSVYYWAWAIFIPFIVISAFVVVNLLIAVICDALQILRTAEDTVLEQKLYGLDNAEGEETMGEGVDDDGQKNPKERVRQRVNEMQKMLDEMILAQEDMARTIQYLSLALYAERKPDELVSIREVTSGDASNREGVD